MSLDINVFVDMVLAGIEEKSTERLFLQWLVQLPNMDKEHYISFKDYISHVKGEDIDRRSNEDIIAEIERNHNIKIEV